MDYRKLIKSYIENEIETINKIDMDQINAALNLLEAGIKREATVYVFGNGGSAATALHIQNDFNKGISEHTKECGNFNCKIILERKSQLQFSVIGLYIIYEFSGIK